MAKQDKKIGLGRGLDALWGQNAELASEEEQNSVKKIDINQIDPNREQARKYFDAEGLEDLAASISASGIIQPLILKKGRQIHNQPANGAGGPQDWLDWRKSPQSSAIMTKNPGRGVL